jgi:hypothetical protein
VNIIPGCKLFIGYKHGWKKRPLNQEYNQAPQQTETLEFSLVSFLLIPSQSLSIGLVDEDEDIHFRYSFCTTLRWIGKGCVDTSWHDFVPPSYLHELDFMIMYDIMTSLTHVIFVLDLSLLWFMMKHGG